MSLGENGITWYSIHENRNPSPVIVTSIRKLTVVKSGARNAKVVACPIVTIAATMEKAATKWKISSATPLMPITSIVIAKRFMIKVKNRNPICLWYTAMSVIKVTK